MQKKTIYSAILAAMVIGGWASAMAVKSAHQTSQIKAHLPQEIIKLADNSTITSSTTIFFSTTTTITHPKVVYQGSEVSMKALQISGIKMNDGQLSQIKLLAQNIDLGEAYTFGDYNTNHNKLAFVLDSGASSAYANIAFALNDEPVMSLDLSFNQAPKQVIALQDLASVINAIDAIGFEVHVPSHMTQAFITDVLAEYPDIWLNPIYPAIDSAFSYQGNQLLLTHNWHQKSQVFYNADFAAQIDRKQLISFIDYLNSDTDDLGIKYTILKQNSTVDVGFTFNIVKLCELLLSSWVDISQLQAYNQMLVEQGLDKLTIHMKGQSSYDAQKSAAGKSDFELGLLPLFSIQGQSQMTSLQGDGIVVNVGQPYSASGLLSFMDMPSDTTRLDYLNLQLNDIAGMDKIIALASNISGLPPQTVAMIVKSHLEDGDSQVIFDAFIESIKNAHPNMPINDQMTLPVRQWGYNAAMQLFDGQKTIGFELRNSGDYSLEQIAMAIYLAQGIVFSDFSVLYDEKDEWSDALKKAQQSLEQINSQVTTCQQAISQAQQNNTQTPSCDLNRLQGQQAQLQQHVRDLQDDLADISNEKADLYHDYLDTLKTLQGVTFTPMQSSEK